MTELWRLTCNEDDDLASACVPRNVPFVDASLNAVLAEAKRRLESGESDSIVIDKFDMTALQREIYKELVWW